MSAIPPNWMSSVIGAHGAQDRANVRKTQETADQADRSQGPNFRQNLQNVIDNSDRDGEVYEDSEGLGSQGRPFSEESEEQAPKNESPAGETETGGSLDVQA